MLQVCLEVGKDEGNGVDDASSDKVVPRSEGVAAV